MAASTHAQMSTNMLVARIAGAQSRRACRGSTILATVAQLALYLISPKQFVMRLGILILVLAVALSGNTRGAVTLPIRAVFKGQDRFEQLAVRAKAENCKSLPIGERTAAVRQALVGTPYRSFTLE